MHRTTEGADSSPLGAGPQLLLVEDSADLGRALETVLRPLYAVTTVTDARSALELGGDDHDVLLVDGQLSDGDGVEVVAALRRRGVTTPVLVLGGGGTPDAVRALDAGADDHLTPPFSFEELLARLRAIRRSRGGGLDRIRIGSWELEPLERLLHSPYTGRVVLTARETGLLTLLARRPHRTFAREELLRRAFPGCDNLGTVDTYVHYVRRKTGPEMITTVHGRGYRIGSP
ncbi:response regulator transcription factor [Pseudolysinimonas sp.]|uniref:response regulator transcription factor n=1 Tax=Pseudolysinimonas sp. TaxID=2680009 RepID=UPI003F80264A